MRTLEEINQEKIDKAILDTNSRQSSDIDVELAKYYMMLNKKEEEGDFTQEPFKRVFKYPRNKPCPCGSGKKFKKCCMDKLK